MTKLLVSVRSAAEARNAIAGGAHVIDVKEPANGPLGAAELPVWNAVAEEVAAAGHCKLSLATGELLAADDRLHNNLSTLLRHAENAGTIVKAGLAGCDVHADWQQRVADWLEALPVAAEPALAAYADYQVAASPAPAEVVEIAKRHRVPFVLLDTFHKPTGNLLTHMPHEQLAAWIAGAKQADIAVAIAGSLPREVPAEILSLQPDYIAVRGAVCRGNRLSDVCQDYVSEMVQVLK